jgi:hypothetical protein
VPAEGGAGLRVLPNDWAASFRPHPGRDPAASWIADPPETRFVLQHDSPGKPGPVGAATGSETSAGKFFKGGAGFFVGRGVLRARRHGAPSLARQRPVDQRVMERAPARLLPQRLAPGPPPARPGSGWFEKRSEPFFFLLAGEVLTRTAATGFTPPHGLALAKGDGRPRPYGADRPL